MVCRDRFIRGALVDRQSLGSGSRDWDGIVVMSRSHYLARLVSVLNHTHCNSRAVVVFGIHQAICHPA